MERRERNVSFEIGQDCGIDADWLRVFEAAVHHPVTHAA